MFRSLALVCVAVFIATWLPSFVEGLSQRAVAKTRYKLCKSHGYNTACKAMAPVSEANSCVYLTCGLQRGNNIYIPAYFVPFPGVPDGTECGKRKVCKNRQCVKSESPSRPDKSKHKFSKCSPDISKTIRTRHDQCKNLGFDVACKESGDYSCQQLRCAYKLRDVSYPVLHPLLSLKPSPILKPLEHTWCGESKICIKGKCTQVSRHELPKLEKPEEFSDNCERVEEVSQCTRL